MCDFSPCGTAELLYYLFSHIPNKGIFHCRAAEYNSQPEVSKVSL